MSLKDKEACDIYCKKLQMLGNNAEGLFEEEKNGIAVNIEKLVEVTICAQTIYIPDFVKYIRSPSIGLDNLFSNVPFNERIEQQVKRIVLSKNVQLDEAAYEIFKRFSNLKIITMTEEQAKQFRKVIPPCTIEIKEET